MQPVLYNFLAAKSSLYKKGSSEGSQHQKQNVIIPIERNFLKITKINAQQEKPVFPNRKNWFPKNTKKHPSAKLNSHKNLVSATQ